MTRHLAPLPAFRLALKRWQAEAKPGGPAPAALFELACRAIRDMESTATSEHRQAQTRARAAIRAMDEGRLDEARAVLRRMLDETIENDARR